MAELTSMMNIGKEMARKLTAVGVDAPEKLARLGAEQAFFQMKAHYPEVCLVHLYTLEGAIQNLPYNALPESRKKELKEFSDGLKGQGKKRDDTEKISRRLQTYIQNRDYVQIIKRTDGEDCKCIPINMSDELLMALRFYDFMPDGYEIIPIQSIRLLRHSKSDIYFGRVVKKEGADKLLDEAPNVELDSWPTVFRFLKKTGEIALVDIGHEGCLNAGVVTRVLKTSIAMRCFSPTGQWDKEGWQESYDNITGVELRNHYIHTFEKHLPPMPPGMGDGII